MNPKNILRIGKDIIFIPRDEIKQLSKKTGIARTIKEIVNKVNDNSRAKVIIDFSL